MAIKLVFIGEVSACFSGTSRAISQEIPFDVRDNNGLLIDREVGKWALRDKTLGGELFVNRKKILGAKKLGNVPVLMSNSNGARVCVPNNGGNQWRNTTNISRKGAHCAGHTGMPRSRESFVLGDPQSSSKCGFNF